ncbi:MAG: type II toxin-antitoxin system VapC family toxin [Propionibacteriaceae bacterium]|jgi:predicted nucleic acid-binding protein|nr:type II toxin-antitoxin system VapC family toxin [Propionibacteriaceae bacterium]
MIVFDTNVVSEPLRPTPHHGVLRWMGAVAEPALTAVTMGELLRGAESLPAGRRRQDLLAAIEATLATWAVVLPYDTAAARCFAALCAKAKSLGRGLSVEDAMIAATCVSRGATLATRNSKDFDWMGLTVVNPWELV